MPKKTKILVFIDWFSPAYKAGGPIRSIVNLIDHCQNDFDFHVITGDRDLGDEYPFKEIVLNSWIESMNYKIIYLSRKKQNFNEFKKLFDEVRPDVVYFNSLFSYKFTLKPYRCLKNNEVNFLLSPEECLAVNL